MNTRAFIDVAKIGDTPTHPATFNLYCGRSNMAVADGWIHADLGNPYPINDVQSREECLARFKAEFKARETPRALVWWDAVEWMHQTARAGHSVRLWCHCKPLACHCDTFQHEAVLRLIFPEAPHIPYSWQT